MIKIVKSKFKQAKIKFFSPLFEVFKVLKHILLNE